MVEHNIAPPAVLVMKTMLFLVDDTHVFYQFHLYGFLHHTDEELSEAHWVVGTRFAWIFSQLDKQVYQRYEVIILFFLSLIISLKRINK